MEDREIVAAIAAGDPDGIAAAYDTYAETVYGYCRWMLRDPAEAAEAVQDTFVIEAARAGGLTDPGLLRSWFFATARGECLRRPSLARGEHVGGAEPEGADEAAGTGEDKRAAERADLRALIPAILAELKPEQREAVVLSLWHDHHDADLAAVLGVSGPEAYAMVSGGRSQLEKALGALRVARTGRAACPELGTLLAGWDGRLTADTLHLARRHVGRCRTCTAGLRGKVRPGALARLLPLPALPDTLRERVLELCAGIVPLTPLPPSLPFDPSAPLSPQVPTARFLPGAMGAAALAGWGRARGHPRMAAGVAAVVVAAAVSVPVLTAGSAHATRTPVPQAGTGTFVSAPLPAGGGTSASAGSVSTGTSRSPSPSSQPTSPMGLVPSAWSPPQPSPTKSARPSRSPSPKASPSSSSPSPSPSPSASPSPTPTHTRTPPPSRSPSPSPSPSDTSSSSPSPSPSASAS